MRLFTTLHQSSFGGELVYRRRGSGGASTGGCTHVSTFSQSFMSVRIEVENNPTLHKSLERFITEETLLVRGCCGCCWLWLLLAVAVAVAVLLWLWLWLCVCMRARVLTP